jgi:cyclohexa-1,5-dienecarbonyl-CoA hydratase
MESPVKTKTELRHDGSLLHITLDAPKANIVDSEMMGEITAAVEQHRHDPELRGIAFEGAGNHFSFGASVEEHTAERARGMLTQFHGLFRLLAEVGVPTFAIVRGQCLGGGMELASYCSWVFAAPEAKFAQPEIKLAVFAPMASVLLPWRLGGGAATDLCVSGRTINAKEAFDLGLVHEVIGDPAAACEAFFKEHLGSLSASSLRFAERAVRAQLIGLLGEHLRAIETMYVDELMATHDANEGINSFLEKRRPVFNGGKA